VADGAHIPICSAPEFIYVNPILIEFATENEKRMANTLFRRNEINKFAWWARNFRSITDYILVNKKNATLVEGRRVCGGADICPDHFLFIGKLAMPKIF
jgi:hypothetical protein